MTLRDGIRHNCTKSRKPRITICDMFTGSSFLLQGASLLLLAVASQPVSVIAQVVDLSNGRYQSYTNATSGLTYFLGMRYAAAPYVLLLYII